MSLHQRQQQKLQAGDPDPSSPRPPSPLLAHQFSPYIKPLLLLLSFLLLSLFFFKSPTYYPFSSDQSPLSRWRDYTLSEAANFVAKNGTVILCAVSYPYMPFLNNWLISVTRQRHHEQVLVVAEDYAILYAVNDRWPGHAVLVPPVPDTQTAHKFGSQVVGFRFGTFSVGFWHALVMHANCLKFCLIGVLQFYLTKTTAPASDLGAGLQCHV